jgi:peptidoglycan/LPS O-acetylase OafA/YrhL
MEATKGNVVYFKYLDILRLFAALFVVFTHGFEGYEGWMGKPKLLTKHFFPDQYSNVGGHVADFFKNGGYGVEIFFLISGFLITYLLLTEQHIKDKIDLVKFYIRRSLRIWPLYFLIIALTPLILYLFNATKADFVAVATAPNYLYYVFFIGNYDVINTGIWQFPYAHFWSICVEEHFYLVWPILLQFIPKKYFYHICIFLILVAMGSRVYYYMYDNSNLGLQVYLNTLCKIDSLIIGAIFAKIHFDHPIKFKFNRVLLFALILIFIWALSIEYWMIMNDLFAIIFKKYVYLFLAAGIMGIILFGISDKVRVFKKGIFSYLGKISYGIYIYHNIFLGFAIQIILLRLQFNFWLFFGIYIAGTILISIISWELFEKPILNFKKRFEIVKTNR